MNRKIAIILLIVVGIYCLPTLQAAFATVLGVVAAVAGTILGVGLSLIASVLPLLIVAYLIWWLVRDNRNSRQH